MTVARVELTRGARRELEEALDWYQGRSHRAAEAFLREVERSFALIADAPRIWPRFEARTRRYLLRRFPFSIIYRTSEGAIEIIALAHHKRRPGYWRRQVCRRLTPPKLPQHIVIETIQIRHFQHHRGLPATRLLAQASLVVAFGFDGEVHRGGWGEEVGAG